MVVTGFLVLWKMVECLAKWELSWWVSNVSFSAFVYRTVSKGLLLVYWINWKLFTQKHSQMCLAILYRSILSLMAMRLEQASQWHEMHCHDLEVTNSNPGRIELAVRGTFVPRRTWTKNILRLPFTPPNSDQIEQEVIYMLCWWWLMRLERTVSPTNLYLYPLVIFIVHMHLYPAEFAVCDFQHHQTVHFQVL